MQRKQFEELTTKQLYAICKLRQDVFVVEQRSIYSDLDDLDQTAIHYLDMNEDEELVSYARYRETQEQQVSIERVVLKKGRRGKGQGKRLLETVLFDIKCTMPNAQISLSAQTDALGFYHLLGFIEQGEPYDDGGIEHILMQYRP